MCRVVGRGVCVEGVQGCRGGCVVVRPEPIIPQFLPNILFLNSYNFNYYSHRTTTLFP